jgi:ATP-dependent DNA helicase RecG
MLDERVTRLTGVGPAAARQLEALGITTVRDLLEHFPRRYADAGEVVDLSQVEVGAPATLVGEVIDTSVRRLGPKGGARGGATGGARGGGRRDLAELTVRQAGGAVFRVTFFNQAWMADRLAPGTVAAFSGKVGEFRGQLQLAAPKVEVLGHVRAGRSAEDVAEELRHQRLLPIYPASGALSSDRIAAMVAIALEAVGVCDADGGATDDGELVDWLDPELRAQEGHVDLASAVRLIHRPEHWEDVRRARERLVFDELLVLQLGLQWRRQRMEEGSVGLDNRPHAGGLPDRLVAALPFPPTGAQARAFVQLAEDLGRERPMHRLLQGDVGAGKTIVALWTMLAAVDRGRQAALMAPTELLAEQHLRTLTSLLAPLGVNAPGGVRVELLTSSTTAAQRRRILADLAAGEVDLAVGTHALIEDGVRFKDLGVVVIDEQHRFGVSQRVALKDKTAQDADGARAAADVRDVLPDVLVMTATPIPRSLALTVYGDLDVTVLDELPPGRTPVRTTLLDPTMPERRERLYDHIRRQAAMGLRAYVVCPLVEPGESGATSAVEHHRHLAEDVFPDLTVALVHGRLRADDKETAMRRFREGEAQVLVATTVIEVGVDVPEATTMVIEDAERFGLSQLHQLRGRVGRGADVSDCALMASQPLEELTEDGRARLEALVASTDGFVLAATDLELRGAGQLFGRRQSGLPDLKLARIERDLDVIGRTRDLARTIVEADPGRRLAVHARMHAEVARRFADDLEDLEALETG